ncbi:MAG: hypothetical protein HOI55_08405 [Candidatus Marinimicrobia bacterium]|nr:hypothetical protein [Candidatus Neomarinimicrobiota bacterium]
MIKYFSLFMIMSSSLFAEEPPEQQNLSGRITYFTIDQVYCDLGLNQQIIIGDTLDVSRRAEILGVIVVSHVANKSSVCEILTPETQFKLGDLVTLRRALFPISSDSTLSDSTQLNTIIPLADIETLKVKQNFTQNGTASIRSNYNQITDEFRFYNSLQYNAKYKKYRFWVFGRSNSTSKQFTLYQAKMDLGSKSRGMFIQLGRVFSAELSGIGATDGIMIQWRKRKHFSLGGLVGAQPDPESFSPDFSIKKMGFFTSYEKSLPSIRFKITSSMVGQYANQEVDREFFYVKLNGKFKKQLSFRAMGIFDYYRTTLGNRSGFNPTSAQLSMQYRLGKTLSFQSRYSQRMRPLYRSTYDSVQDSIISDELISGWMNSIRISNMKFGSVQLGGNVRKQSSGDYAYLAQFNLRSIEIQSTFTLGWSANLIQNDLIKGVQNQFQYDRTIGRFGQIYFEYEIYHYGYGLSPFDNNQQTISMTYNLKIFNSIYLYGTVDTVIDDLGDPLIHLFLGTSYRF